MWSSPGRTEKLREEHEYVNQLQVPTSDTDDVGPLSLYVSHYQTFYDSTSPEFSTQDPQESPVPSTGGGGLSNSLLESSSKKKKKARHFIFGGIKQKANSTNSMDSDSDDCAADRSPNITPHDARMIRSAMASSTASTAASSETPVSRRGTYESFGGDGYVSPKRKLHYPITDYLGDNKARRSRNVKRIVYYALVLVLLTLGGLVAFFFIPRTVTLSLRTTRFDSLQVCWENKTISVSLQENFFVRNPNYSPVYLDDVILKIYIDTTPPTPPTPSPTAAARAVSGGSGSSGVSSSGSGGSGMGSSGGTSPVLLGTSHVDSSVAEYPARTLTSQFDVLLLKVFTIDDDQLWDQFQLVYNQTCNTSNTYALVTSGHLSTSTLSFSDNLKLPLVTNLHTVCSDPLYSC
mmetsp:Transcript_3508/g.6646  ORF Transcript_3508/g.6646 Transcript_3508/m.6646 type:complete len:405 (+) Transcript_3508:58-1272(+)